MSLPINFAPTPKDTSTSPADAEAAFEAVGDATEVNFERINTFYRGRTGIIAARTDQTGTFPTWSSGGHAFTAAEWPPVTVVLPANPALLWVHFTGDMQNDQGGTIYLDLYMMITGATSWVNDQGKDRMMINGNGHIGCGLNVIVPAANLTPSGTVTITPHYALSPGGTGEISIRNGTLNVLAFSA